MAKVSVIIPIYNTEKFIERCATSLFEQTLDDIEYIFISDCSPDNSLEILRNTLEKYPNRIAQTKIIEFPENKGVAFVRKYGITIAQGEYIANCDSDDWVDVNMYKTLYELAYSRDYDIVRCKFARCSNSEIKECYNVHPSCYDNKLTYLSCLLKEYDLNSLCDKLIKKTIFKNYDIIYPCYHMYEDNVLNIQLSYYAKSIGYIDKILYYYYINPMSITHITNERKLVDRLGQKKFNVDIIINFLNNRGIGDLYKEEIASLKYSVREDIQPIIYQKGMYTLWLNTYPELSVNSFDSNKLKIKYLLNLLRLSFIIDKYRILHKIIFHRYK